MNVKITAAATALAVAALVSDAAFAEPGAWSDEPVHPSTYHI